MTLIIEARLEGEGVDPINAPILLAVIDLCDDVLDPLCALAVCQPAQAYLSKRHRML